MPVSADRGLALDPGLVVFLTVVLPELVALVAMGVWGRLFDRWNFILLRIAINCFFIASILVYFNPGFTYLVVGSLLFGAAKGGGTIAWSLWVTKFSEPDRTADYMAVHTFLTGCRGLSTAFISFALVGSGLMTIGQVGWLGAGLIIIATLGLLPIISMASAETCYLVQSLNYCRWAGVGR